MPTVISKDGSSISYDITGTGPVLVLVNGALSHRNLYGEQELAAALSGHYTVIFYDRRGRGESTDNQPYSAEKEIDDIEALIDNNGGSAYLYGCSSGAALAMLAAAKLGPGKIIKLALYEPPYGSHPHKDDFINLKKRINELVASGAPGEAVGVFLKSLGSTDEDMDNMKRSPQWKLTEAVGHTLPYDFEILGDSAIPVQRAKVVSMPTLVMAGGESFDFMHTTADMLAEIIPAAVRKTLRGQTHQVSPAVLAPELTVFFK